MYISNKSLELNTSIYDNGNFEVPDILSLVSQRFQ